MLQKISLFCSKIDFTLQKIMIKVTDECRSLIAEMIFLVEGVTVQFKKEGFDRIKRRMLRTELKRLHKNNFESVKSSSESSSTSNMLSNYVSITDFKPLDANYSSIKIIDYETHGIKKDITTTLAKKIEYTSNQLLNKETFLQNWMIREPLIDSKPQKYPFSDYANKKINSYSEDALNSVRKFTFSQYCKLNVKKKNGFFSLTESDPMKYKNTCISASLTHMKQSQNEIAIEAFQILLRAGGDLQTKHNYLYEISQLIEIMMKGNDNIKQEIFLQIIKQISSKKEIYLRVLCSVCYCVKPSTRIYIPILNYLYQQYALYQNLPKELLNYCFFHLIRNFDKERKASPCLFQLFCAYHGSKIPITISFPKEKVFFVQSYTSVEEFLSELIEYYNLDTQIEYLLEINGFLMEKGNLLDNLNHYSEVDDEELKWKDYEAFKGLSALIVLKNVNDSTFSPRCHSIMYNYSANQYLRGLYSLRSTDIVNIAALKMYSEMDDEEEYLFEFDNLITQRKLRVLTSEEKEKYRKHILKQYFKINHISRIEARKEILNILSKSRGFNTHFFKAQIFVQDYDEFLAWVGVQKERLLIVEPATGRIMRSIPYNKIKQWGKSKSELCLRIDNRGQFHIDSRQVDVLTSVFQNYLHYYSNKMTTI